MNTGFEITRYDHNDEYLGNGVVFTDDCIILDTEGHPTFDYNLQIIQTNIDIDEAIQEYDDDDLPDNVQVTELCNQDCEENIISNIISKVYTINNKHIIIHNKYEIHDHMGVDHVIIIKKK